MNHVHFIGIGGIGMSGLARILLQKKVKVSGSDIALNSVTEQLEKMGANIFEGHSASHVEKGCTVVFTSQVHVDNPEVAAAKKLGCPLLHRSELLAHLTKGKKTLAVAGTHGKTTTSSLLTHVLLEADFNPAYAVGGIINALKNNASWGTGDYFVIEADESDGTFLNYTPYGAIVTNIDDDHLDHYGTEKELIAAFGKFLTSVENKQCLLWGGDNASLGLLGSHGDSYGVGTGCCWKVNRLRQVGWHIYFDLYHEEECYSDIRVKLTGIHNVLNSAGVFALCIKLGVPEKSLRKALENFSGVSRRSETKGMAGNILVVDDYGHHPTEIKTTLNALRHAEPHRRLVVAFQPHRYSRTQNCMEGFAQAFGDADELIVTDIYSAHEDPIPGIDANALINRVRESSKTSCQYFPRGDVVRKLSLFVKPNDLVVTLGAGDITRVGPELISHFTAKHGA